MPLRWTFATLKCRDLAGSSLAMSFWCIFIHPCANLPLLFEQWQFNIISISGVTSQSCTSGCLGDFWTLLDQCCWWGVVFSEKAFQHSGNPTQQWKLSTEVSRLFSTMTLLFVMLSAHVYQLMWLTTSSYLSPIRFHSVSLSLCAVGKHSTFESIIERPYRCGSLSSGEWQQCPGTKQCGFSKGSNVKCPVIISC